VPDHAERKARAESLAQWIRQEVNEPGLRMTPLLRIAWAIVDGDYPMDLLHGVLRQLRLATQTKKFDVCRRAYFLGSMKRSFDGCGLTLQSKRLSADQKKEEGKS
jgi:hypothetical protein